METNLPNNKPFYIQAHRGYSEIYPENTLLAISKAFDAGADQVEIDIALTKDGHLVVMHDLDVARTTDGRGTVSSLTLDEITRLDAGSWKGESFRGERVPTLAQAAEAAQGRGWLNIEIKSRGRVNLPLSDIAAGLSRTLRSMEMHSKAIVASFDLQPLLEVQRHDPDLRLMLIDWDPPDSGGLQAAIKSGLYGWTPKPELAALDRIECATEAGLVVQVDVRKLEQIGPWRRAGVKGFSSDNPEQLKAYLLDQGMLAS